MALGFKLLLSKIRVLFFTPCWVSCEQKKYIVISHFRDAIYLCFKRSPMYDLSYENEIDLQDNERSSKTHLYKKDCAPGVAIKQR